MSTYIESGVSNLTESPDVKALKISLQEYADIIVNTPIFNSNNNIDDISKLIYTILEDLYIKEPEEAINFLNQLPSKNFINNLFSSYGISDKLNKNYPEILKLKTAYLLSQLFEAKGSIVIYNLFNNIVKEFYQNLNFYNVRIEQRKFVSKYEYPVLDRFYYIDINSEILPEYNVQEADAQFLKDETVNVQIFTTLNTINKQVVYHLKFDKKLPNKARVKLNFSQQVEIESGIDETYITIKAFDIYDKKVRDINDLSYKLEPLLLNDPDNIVYEISPTELRTSKYLMEKINYFNTDITNSQKTNIFPIITNILYIQFNSSETIDSMSYLPDLVRMFAMTDMQHDIFTFAVKGSIIKINLQDYMNILMYLKLKELELRQPGWKWETDQVLEFYSFTFPYEKRDDIYKLLIYYKDMKHDHEQFLEFKRRYTELYSAVAQKQTTKIFNITQFREYLAGNVPDTFEGFFQAIETFYPTGINIILGKDQNLIFKEKILELFNIYHPNNVSDFLNIIALHDKDYVGLNNGLYDILKQTFTERYPRIIQKIDNITDPKEVIEVYLDNYKRMGVQVAKKDNFCKYFVNDTFQRFLLASSFKEYFFNPIIDLFNQYFFKAEQSYQNANGEKINIRDKMQMVTCGVSSDYQTECNGYFSETKFIDYSEMIIRKNISNEQINNDDKFIIEIFDDITTSIFTSESDAPYGASQ